MTYKQFEDLPVWKAAINLAGRCEDFLEMAGSNISRGKADQLDRCSLSVSNNIAEGFERGTTKELLAFLYISRGSAGETRSMMRFFASRPKLKPHAGLIGEIAKAAESCGRQLRAWADQLQNSDIQGQRHLNEESRSNYNKRQQGRKSRESFQEKVRARVLNLPDGDPAKKRLAEMYEIDLEEGS
ncbi:MAG: four helix bundle protein [Verrucomicrobiales bacterium]|nr:four helix bundle protein [Verrucomicrobiales bacterium]